MFRVVKSLDRNRQSNRCKRSRRAGRIPTAGWGSNMEREAFVAADPGENRRNN